MYVHVYIRALSPISWICTCSEYRFLDSTTLWLTEVSLSDSPKIHP